MKSAFKWLLLVTSAALVGLVLVAGAAGLVALGRGLSRTAAWSPDVQGPGPQGLGGGRGFPGGWGPGGMRGRWGQAVPPGSSAITLDQAVDIAKAFPASRGYTDIEPTEVMEFTNNFYAEYKEKSTGIHAFEVLIDKYSGIVTPEMGPNMMWNTKYGMMGGGGMMGGWFRRSSPTAQMPVTAEQARRYAQQYLDANLPGTQADEEVDTFYGYYGLHVLQGGKVYGMLSVNGQSGQVWYHTWHGDFIRMKELD